ncbi:MAG: T9SS type A sorting domain-containing protein [Bacteroidales bacterium]|nr:T9SS type A sorting domain-containing protein [Bacteroidales bacterium]
MNNFLLFRHGVPYVIGILALLSSSPILAQYDDDPNFDRIPLELMQQSQQQTDAILSSVVTIGNYDNFSLGVDFAEGNIAENPAMPSWYFAAFNTNGTHHTEDGIAWAINNPSFGVSVQGDPVQSYDSLGNLFYENMYGNITGCKVVVSTDNGATWSTAVTAIAGVDKNWLAADQTAGPYANYVYTTMTRNGGGNFARSMDHGLSWTTTFQPSTQSLPGMMVAVGPHLNIQGGAVYVVTNGGNAFASNYTFYRSLDGGATFSNMSSQFFSGYVGTNVNGRNSVQNMRTRPYPFIAADNSYGANRGRLYCVYASNDPPGNGNKPDIWCRHSDDEGVTWSAAVRVNDDASATQHNQWHPAIWCDKETGRLYINWMDTRDTPTSDSALIYASYSDDGGATFVTNHPISNQKMKINCTTCGGGGTPRYQGDYGGMVANKKTSMSSWADFRNGSFLSMTAYFPDFAMALTPASGTLSAPSDSMDFTVSVPAVKLYTDTVVLTGQVTPAPTTGTITFSYPQGNKITTFPGSKTVRVKVTGSVPAATYQLTFFAKGPNGTPAHQRGATLTVQVTQTLGVSVTASPTAVCTGNSTQLQASVTGGVTPYTYTWSSNPTGFSSTLPNPSASPTVDTWYICTVHDNVPTTVKDSVQVTVTSLPATPGAITGSTTPCEGIAETYTIAAVTGATTYTWTAPAGSTILSGQGTVSASIQLGPNSGDISVTAGNTCGNSSASMLAVTVSPLPLSPGTITGPTNICSGTSDNYSVATVTGVTNNWTVPSGATITSGQGTPSITVLWGNNSGPVVVDAENSCGTGPSSTLNVTVQTIPTGAQAISGPDTVCQGESGYPYSVPLINNASSYIWTLPPGASISQGQGSNAIVVDFSGIAVSGDLAVAGNNECGTGTSSSKYIDVMVCTGLDETKLRSHVTISPNPVSDRLSVSINGSEKQIRMMIMDAQGHMVYQETLTDLPASFVQQIDVRSFAKGLYLIRLINEPRVFNGKFVVE